MDTWPQRDPRFNIAPTQTLDELMQPAAENALKFTEVSSYVNKSSNEGPEWTEPIAA